MYTKLQYLNIFNKNETFVLVFFNMAIYYNKSCYDQKEQSYVFKQKRALLMYEKEHP